MNIQIALFLAFGACFGLATYSWQHIFSEGPTRPAAAGGGPDIGGRLMWALVCTFLWPLMVLTGMHSAWRLSRRAAARRAAEQASN